MFSSEPLHYRKRPLYVDIVTGDGQMWEVKPWRDSPIGFGDGYYEVTEAQLDKYASINSNLTRGAQYEDILGIEVVGDLRMDIQFFDQGKIRYSFYLQHEDDVYALITSRAEDYIEANNSYPPTINIKFKPGRGKR
ncbi:hypothetical protein ACK8P5_20470 [Paenibacillus sp. EC2-1]|uniref:hypothetical protein n=1 Tax=Paenibacillus sp. EC2-1 TaxID=3388665 RepID=UPI003BEF43ED